MSHESSGSGHGRCSTSRSVADWRAGVERRSGARRPGRLAFRADGNSAPGRWEMGQERERNPQEAIEDIREKRGDDEELNEEEQEFLESEGVQLDEGEGTGKPVA
jgi:hypothetical protein